MSPACDHVGIFGYGSLVSRHTLNPDVNASPFRVHGWKRSWRHCVETDRGKVCALTVAPHAAGQVAGVVLRERRERLPALDAREQGYRRVPLPFGSDGHAYPLIQKMDEMFTYVSCGEAYRSGSLEFPIWRSYLECVLIGFLDLGGRPAVDDFIATTDGWDTPILDDRLAPKYVRALRLAPDIHREVDAIIRAHALDTNQFKGSAAEIEIVALPPDSDEFG